jgi:hypothetical protein
MKIAPLALALVIIALTCSSALAQDQSRAGGNRFSTDLSGYNEVHFIFDTTGFPTTPPTAALRGAVSTEATGKFTARIDDVAKTIDYELSYSNLDPQGTVTQAHIHFGQPHTVGGIVVWLCQTAGTPHPTPDLGAVTPICPPSGTVTGTIRPEDVLAVTGQGIAAGDFDELVRAIRAGATYANVHSTVFRPGEIRGQIGHGNHN